MTRKLAALLTALTLLWAAPIALLAQAEAVPEDAEEAAGQVAEQATAVVPTEAEAFAALAARAEELAARDDASMFAISRLRAELVIWRDRYAARAGMNAGRLATVNAQIAALGPVPESGEEAPSVAARRAELISQRQALMAPRLLAEEALARASGLIREFDARALERETALLTQRGPTPLDPAAMLAAAGALWGLAQIMGAEITSGVSVGNSSGALWSVFPRALALILAGIALLSLGRGTVTRWLGILTGRRGRLVPLARFVVSSAQIVVPVVGLFAVTGGLELTGVFGLRSSDMVAAIPVAGFCAVFGWWAAVHIFPQDRAGHLHYGPQTRRSGRRYTMAIAWVLAAAVLVSAGARTMEISAVEAAAAEWPVVALLGLLLWRLGRVIKTAPELAEGQLPPQGRMRVLIGRFCTVVAILAPAVGAIGYAQAATSLMSGSILSLGLVAVLFLLQRITSEMLEQPAEDSDNRGLYALLPVFVSFTLFLLSAPLFALIWGAQEQDLLEVWARFREGFAIGETRLSPTDFLMFVLVFALGYLLTRFVQGLLRRSVLPRTRLDIGAQNAAVAGFGYVGIILAAIVAITSAGLDLSNLAIVAGALSVGIGFGLQNIVSNFVSGIILLIERPVSEGDWIEVGGQMGYVRSISVRSTRIETFDRTDVIIPNADLVSGQVTNWTRGNSVGRVIVPVGVAYGTDTEKVTQILREIAEGHPQVMLDPPPAVLFRGFGADSLDFEIRAIMRDVNYVLVTKSEMNHQIAKKFAEAGIEIPFAQRDIWLRNPEVLKG